MPVAAGGEASVGASSLQRPRRALPDRDLVEVALDVRPQSLGVGLGEPGPLGEVAARGRTVEAQEAADRLGGRRRATGLAEDVAALGVQARPGLHGRRSATASARRGGSRSPRTTACRSSPTRSRSSSCSSILLSARPPRSASFVAVGDLLERVGRGEALLGREPLDLLAELLAQLVVVARDQRPPVEREVVGRERVDRSPHDVRDDELAAVDGLVVALAREVLHPRRDGEQRGVAGEVRGGAGRRLGEARRVAARPAPSGPAGRRGSARPAREEPTAIGSARSAAEPRPA